MQLLRIYGVLVHQLTP